MQSRLLVTLAAVLIPLAANAVEPALGGHCPVCLVEMGKAVPGSGKQQDGLCWLCVWRPTHR